MVDRDMGLMEVFGLEVAVAMVLQSILHNSCMHGSAGTCSSSFLCVSDTTDRNFDVVSRVWVRQVVGMERVNEVQAEEERTEAMAAAEKTSHQPRR